MNKRRFQALVMTSVMIVSIILSGCNNSGKKSGKKSRAEKDATAMLDDVCAYIKSAKYDKIERLIDGRSKWLGTLENYAQAEVKGIFEAARKRIDYSIEDVVADEDEGEGEAVLVFSYFDTKDMRKKISSDSTDKKIIEAIKEANDKEIEVEVEIVYDDDEWLIDGGSFDEVSKELFSFIEDLDMDTVPAPTTEKTTTPKELVVNYEAWNDEDYLEVEGYHQSTDLVRLTLSFWDPCPKQTFTYEFEDEQGNITQGSIDVDDDTYIVHIDWNPGYKLPVGWIACTVYAEDGTLLTVACVQIYDDNEQLPVKFYCYECEMTDEAGIPVPGYHASDTALSAYVRINEFKGVEITYALVEGNGYSSNAKELYRNTVAATANRVDLTFTDLANPGPGEYALIVYDMVGSETWTLNFDILNDNEEFKMDADRAVTYYDYFTWEEEEYRYIDEIPVDARKICFYAETEDYYQYMQFTYKAEDADGNVLGEGYTTIVTGYELRVEIDVSALVKGPLKISVFNPDGSLLIEKTIEEEN